MKIKKNFNFNDRIMATLFLLAVYGLIFTPHVSLAEIPVDSYCQLSLQSMQQEMSNMQELIVLAQQYKNNPAALAREEEKKRAESDQAKDALYSSFGTTSGEYITYMGRHSQEVQAYLKENPAIKQQLDDLSAQLNSLLNKYEALKSEGKSSPPPLH